MKHFSHPRRDLGTDDYLTKPFGTGELLGRIKAVLRRARWAESVPEQEVITCGEILADLVKHQVTLKNQTIELTPTEFNLLVYLMKNVGKVLPYRNSSPIRLRRGIKSPGYSYEAAFGGFSPLCGLCNRSPDVYVRAAGPKCPYLSSPRKISGSSSTCLNAASRFWMVCNSVLSLAP
jgi:hypothetical protein